MANRFYTIGYEGRNIDGFVGDLHGKHVKCLIDVREIPLSRKRGFSKSSLSRRLHEEGISYVHFKELGSPKDVRDELKATKDYVRFFAEMDKYLSAQSQAVESVYEHVMDQTCCLMCFERLASQCHRKTVAKKIKERDGNGLQVTHI